MHRMPAPDETPTAAPGAQDPRRPRTPRVTGVGLLRSGVSAGGAVAGGLVAVPVGGALVTVLFARLGTRIVRGIVAGEVTEGLSGLEGLVAAIALVIAGVAVAILVVCALVAPVFVVLPLVGVGVALRVARAGLIIRTLWLSLAALVLVVVASAALIEALDARGHWWMWAAAVAFAGFLGRFAVELWEPRAAGVRTPVAMSRRWKVLLVVWAGLVVVATVAGVALFLVVV